MKGWIPESKYTSKGPTTRYRSGKARKRRERTKRKGGEQSRWKGRRLAVIMVVTAGAAVAAALLFLGGNTSTDQGQTTQTTWATETTTKLGGDVFKIRVFGHADSADKDEWWLAFNIAMTPTDEWSDVTVAPEVFFVQLTDRRYVSGQGVRNPMTLQTGSDTVSVSGKDEFPTTRVQPEKIVSGLVLFLLPRDTPVAKMVFNNGRVTADLGQLPT